MLSLAAGLLLAALTLGLKASAESQWLPSDASRRAAERGENCSLLRQLQSDNQSFAAASRGALEAQIRRAKGQRDSLLACAKSKGVPLHLGDLSESSMAEFCGPQFAIWIHQGYQAERIRQDLNQADKDLQWVSTHLASNCPGPARKEVKPALLRPRQPERLLKMAWLRGQELPR